MKLTHTLLTVLPISGAAGAQWVVGVVLVAVVGGGVARAQATERESVATGGAEGNSLSAIASVSADGRFVAFHSNATNLVAGDTNGVQDVFVRDRLNGTTECVSVDPAGALGNGGSSEPLLSADGRFVAFRSVASNLVAGDTNGFFVDVFVRDRQTGTTERVSVSSAGMQSNGASFDHSISADGRFVAFASDATFLVAGDGNGWKDVFVRDRLSGTTARVSLTTGGAQGNGHSTGASVSGLGRYVAFASVATNLVAGDTNDAQDVFVRDLLLLTNERVSVDSAGTQGNALSLGPSVSGDGRYVAFESSASNLVAGDTNGFKDVFVRDRQSGTTVRVNVATGGAQGNLLGSAPSISADGRFVAFHSNASNLVAGDTNATGDVFVRDLQNGTTERVSVATGGAEGNSASAEPSISGGGRYVAFESGASNLVAGDTNGTIDVFVHDRDASGFTSFCEPGLAGVIPCACSNPPSGPGRGCENSASTGGASLSAAGVAYLSMDSLVLTTSGGLPSSTSIVLQGNAESASGIVFGQGVRCVAGSLKRLYVKVASGGSIMAPDFGAGDPTISARSSALGDPIAAGENRFYLVYYRDPIVLGSCPAASTFNATQTGRVTWSL